MQITVDIENKFVVDYSMFVYHADKFERFKREATAILNNKDINQLIKIVADLGHNLNNSIDYKSKILYAENTFASDVDRMIGLYRQRVENKLDEAKKGNLSFGDSDESYEVTIHILNWYLQKKALVNDLQPLWFMDFRFRLSNQFFSRSLLWQEACKAAEQQKLPYTDRFIETDYFLEKLVVFFKNEFLNEVAETDWKKVDARRFTDRLLLDYFRNSKEKYLVTTEFY